jgi:hypothetical protein
LRCEFCFSQDRFRNRHGPVAPAASPGTSVERFAFRGRPRGVASGQYGARSASIRSGCFRSSRKAAVMNGVMV